MPLPFYVDFSKEAGAQSREKAKAERRVQRFQSSEKKDWDSFTANTARKSFVQQLGKDPMTDPKLLQYADNMNRLKTGTKVGTVPGEAGKSYEITKLRGSERLGCTCNDWRYKRSVAQPGEEQDCKHIKQYRQMSKTAAASFKDTLPNPVIDGKPHSGTWTIVGSGRLSIPKKTSDIDYMVPLEEVKDLSGFQEYADVPGVYWRDSETIDGRPSTIVALPRYAYDKIDASYQQATDRFGKRKLRQLKKTLPKDSFYKDIGVVYTSDAMKKESGHVEDRIAERAPGAEAEVNTLRAKLRQMQLRKGQTYHVPLSRGRGYAVIGDVGDKHAVKTVLGPNMRPPGERLKLARAPRDYKREYEQYHAKPEQVENRSLRNQARRKLGLKKGDPREVDHKTPLSKGGGNGHSNLRAVSRKTNRTKFTDPS